MLVNEGKISRVGRKLVTNRVDLTLFTRLELDATAERRRRTVVSYIHRIDAPRFRLSDTGGKSPE